MRHVWEAYSAGGADSVTCSRPAAGEGVVLFGKLAEDIIEDRGCFRLG